MHPAKPRSDASGLPWAAATLFGAAVGGAAWALTVWARAYCDAGYDAGGRLTLNLLLPLAVGVGALAGPAALAIGRRLARPAPPALRRALPALLVLAVTFGLAWWFFATQGTLAGYPGDSGRCPASNVPPAWPGWLPA
ncbi:hypothetical protein RM844_18495 [Streptomyces sp. DSM 44915]|uniref:Uncharacterized protein n=1 Tax=Streptomyces chisholmiae TaxID=3075540 RepID=A0ABU2JTF8_9ACTN|nr:hypothetical protein [Streptomyces sp. DSM 44915]MDT0268276.1 hypothetical protein [Streptomyces sp. DSM 44915]